MRNLMHHKINPLQHQVRFKTQDDLFIEIETERLKIRSVQPQDEKACIQLFGDPKVMEKFATGVPYEEQKTRERMTVWRERWKNHDPFSVYAILDKKTDEFMGIFALGHSEPGETEASYLFHHRFWGKGYGSEAGDAVIQSLIPRLMLRGYSLEHAPLKKCVATARLDNPASQQILKNTGFKETAKVEKYGAWRYSYLLFAKQVKNDYEHFFTNRDRLFHQKQQAEIRNCGVDVTVEEMMNSAFGRGSFTARKY